MRKRREVFQYLIGSLSTKESGIPLNRTTGFQYLIGSLSTDGLISYIYFRSIAFQYLIGSLSTGIFIPREPTW